MRNRRNVSTSLTCHVRCSTARTLERTMSTTCRSIYKVFYVIRKCKRGRSLTQQRHVLYLQPSSLKLVSDDETTEHFHRFAATLFCLHTGPQRRDISFSSSGNLTGYCLLNCERNLQTDLPAFDGVQLDEPVGRDPRLVEFPILVQLSRNT